MSHIETGEQMGESVRVSLDDRDSALFAEIKDQLGIKADSEVFRFLVTYYARQEGIVPRVVGRTVVRE